MTELETAFERIRELMERTPDPTGLRMKATVQCMQGIITAIEAAEFDTMTADLD